MVKWETFVKNNEEINNTNIRQNGKGMKSILNTFIFCLFSFFNCFLIFNVLSVTQYSNKIKLHQSCFFK